MTYAAHVWKPFIRFDKKKARDWSLTATAQRVTLLAALGLIGIVAIPTFTKGQDYMPRSESEYEFRDLREKIDSATRRLDKFDDVKPLLGVMQYQINTLVIGQQKTEDWQSAAFKGLLACVGSFMLVLLSKLATSMGITFNRKQGRNEEIDMQ